MNIKGLVGFDLYEKRKQLMLAKAGSDKTLTGRPVPANKISQYGATVKELAELYGLRSWGRDMQLFRLWFEHLFVVLPEGATGYRFARSGWVDKITHDKPYGQMYLPKEIVYLTVTIHYTQRPFWSGHLSLDLKVHKAKMIPVDYVISADKAKEIGFMMDKEIYPRAINGIYSGYGNINCDRRFTVVAPRIEKVAELYTQTYSNQYDWLNELYIDMVM